jgi:S-adenosylmethionine-diacylgycerolhomoserine-N-methlytransferase
MKNTFEKMDRMYRGQRYIYDATRRFYLLGRDDLLKLIDPRPEERVLEIGCGTARNLIALAKTHPEAEFFGLDASSAMLETANAKVEAAGVTNIELRTALADDFTYAGTFLQPSPFDKAFLSYSISMIPTWKPSIENALANIREGGTLFIVDFYDQAQLPGFFRTSLKWWLSKFHVQYWEGLIPFLRSLEDSGRCKVSIIPVFRRYAFIAVIEKL